MIDPRQPGGFNHINEFRNSIAEHADRIVAQDPNTQTGPDGAPISDQERRIRALRLAGMLSPQRMTAYDRPMAMPPQDEYSRKGMVNPDTFDRPLSRFSGQGDMLPARFVLPASATGQPGPEAPAAASETSRPSAPVASRPAAAVARPSLQTENVPLPPPRPAEFSQPTSRQMYQAIDPNDERAGTIQFILAAAKEAQEQRAAREAAGKAMGGAAGYSHGGYASGGSTASTASSGSGNAKDAALLKALEIIHHMIRTR